jgi:hypothetical protein
VPRDRVQWWALLNTVLNLQSFIEGEEFPEQLNNSQLLKESVPYNYLD